MKLMKTLICQSKLSFMVVVHTPELYQRVYDNYTHVGGYKEDYVKKFGQQI